jgi:hypothetical protein
MHHAPSPVLTRRDDISLQPRQSFARMEGQCAAAVVLVRNHHPGPSRNGRMEPSEASWVRCLSLIIVITLPSTTGDAEGLARGTRMTARKLAPTKLSGGGRGQDVGQPADPIRAHAGPQPRRRSKHEFRALLNEAGSTGLEGIRQQGRRCCRRYDPAASGRRTLSRAISARHRNRACLSAVAPVGQGLRKPHEVPGIADERTKMEERWCNKGTHWRRAAMRLVWPTFSRALPSLRRNPPGWCWC